MWSLVREKAESAPQATALSARGQGRAREPSFLLGSPGSARERGAAVVQSEGRAGPDSRDSEELGERPCHAEVVPVWSAREKAGSGRASAALVPLSVESYGTG